MSETPFFNHILAFDCAGAASSAALMSNGRILAHRFLAMERGHAETLLPQIAAVMAEAEADFNHLDLIVTTVGPGSFTGLRIGLAAARGLALATGKPVIGVDCFETVLADATGPDRPAPPADIDAILVILDSKRGPVFARRFSPDHQPLGPPITLEITDFLTTARALSSPLWVMGDGLRCLEPHALPDTIRLCPDTTHLDARVIARIASRFTAGSRDRIPIEPLYLRPPDVTVARPRQNFAPPSIVGSIENSILSSNPDLKASSMP